MKKLFVSFKAPQQLIAVNEWGFIGVFQSARRFRNENILNRAVLNFPL